MGSQSGDVTPRVSGGLRRWGAWKEPRALEREERLLSRVGKGKGKASRAGLLLL